MYNPYNSMNRTSILKSFYFLQTEKKYAEHPFLGHLSIGGKPLQWRRCLARPTTRRRFGCWNLNRQEKNGWFGSDSANTSSQDWHSLMLDVPFVTRKYLKRKASCIPALKVEHPGKKSHGFPRLPMVKTTCWDPPLTTVPALRSWADGDTRSSLVWY